MRMSPSPYIKAAKNLVKKAEDRRSQYGIVRFVDTTTIDVSPGNSSTVLKHIPVVGDINSLALGEVVKLAWWKNQRPIVFLDENRDTGFAALQTGWYQAVTDLDRITDLRLSDLETLTANNKTTIVNPIGMIGGWYVDGGRLYSGTGTDHVQTQFIAYRLPHLGRRRRSSSRAVFCAEVGAVFATSGLIAGWSLETNQFSADSGLAILNSSDHPFLGLGGADAYGEAGIWLGKDADDVYKMYIGDPLGNSLNWDGNSLTVTGTMISASEQASAVAGWLIVAKDCGTLPSDVGSSDSAIDFGQAMTPDDYVLIRALDTAGVARTEYILVGALVSGTTYNVTRTSGQSWPAGTAYQVLGQSGAGYLELNAYDTPRLSIMQMTATPQTPTELIRLGDLASWQSAGFTGNGIAIGDYAGNKYLKYNSDGLVVRGEIKADAGYLGALSVDGVLSLGASGGIYQGTGTFGTPTTGLKIVERQRGRAHRRIQRRGSAVVNWYGW